MTKYIFWADSIDGLRVDIEVLAINYTAARQKVLKCIALRSEFKHPVRGRKPSW